MTETDVRSTPFAGGCACGAVRFQVAGQPAAVADCQCRQCQKDSGTGHGSHLTFAGAQVRLNGKVACFEVVGDGGTVKSRHFCPVCGVLVWLKFPAMPDLIVLRAGTLDEPERYRPQFVTWCETAPSWDQAGEGIKSFPRMPE